MWKRSSKTPAPAAYTGGVSIEPHMVVRLSRRPMPKRTDDATRVNFVEYGQRLGALVSKVSQSLPANSGDSR